jgi:uncharacterized protein YbjT (DUF2867 family)
MNKKSAIIAGASGLTGSSLLKIILASNHYEKVKILSRNNQTRVKTSDYEIVQINYDQIEDSQSQLIADDWFCCLGSTLRKAGSEEEFRKVDVDYVSKLARIAQFSAKTFSVISSVGANANSFNYYLKAKGEMEMNVMNTTIEGIHIFRPGLILGKREEKRPLETLANKLLPAFNFLLPYKYKCVPAESLAMSMLLFSQNSNRGKYIYSSGDIIQRCKGITEIKRYNPLRGI